MGGGGGRREGEREAVCQKGDWSRGIVMTSRSFLSFFLSCFPSLSPGVQTKGSASCGSRLCHPGVGSPGREGWPRPARGPYSARGQALLWLLVGNPEQGLPRRVGGGGPSPETCFSFGARSRGRVAGRGSQPLPQPLVPRTGGLRQAGGNSG